MKGSCVLLVVDPHTVRVIGVEDARGKHLGAVTPLDAAANLHRVRHRLPASFVGPASMSATGPARASTAPPAQPPPLTPNLIEHASSNMR